MAGKGKSPFGLSKNQSFTELASQSLSQHALNFSPKLLSIVAFGAIAQYQSGHVGEHEHILNITAHAFGSAISFLYFTNMLRHVHEQISREIAS